MILGLSNPQFNFNGTNVILNNAILDPTFMDAIELMHQSIINSERTWRISRDYASFLLTVYLYKYSDPEVKLKELLSYKNELVTFYPNVDGQPIKDLTGNAAQFYIASMQPFYVNTDESYDAVNIAFVSSKYIKYLTQQAEGYGFNYGMFYGLGL